jgi:hypothetical protein
MSRTTVLHRRSAVALVAGAATAAVVAGAVVAAPALAVDGAPDAGRTTSAVDPNDALLTKTQMPVVNEVQDWKRVPVRHRRVSTAQPTALTSLGFEDKARRDFALPGAESTDVVLTFADAAAAREAFAEIKAWRRHTGDNVPAKGELLYTSKQTPVAVPEGRGSFFAFVFKSDTRSEEGTFEWLGVTRRGAAVSVVAWRVGGTDATYEVDPTIASVKAANAKLGRLD